MTPTGRFQPLPPRLLSSELSLRIDEGNSAMQARRSWTPVATMSPSEPTGSPASEVRPTCFGVTNERYASPRGQLDRNTTRTRFVAVDGWRESMRQDATLRAVLLNPVDYEPRAD
jgi:hypothetical protein